MGDIQLPRRRAGGPPPAWRCPECGGESRAIGVRFVRTNRPGSNYGYEFGLRAVDRCAGCGYEHGRPATPAEWERLRGEEKPSHQRLPPAEKEERARVRRARRAIEREQERGWETEEETEEAEAAEVGALPHIPGWLKLAGLVGGALGLGWLGWRLSRRPEPGGPDEPDRPGRAPGESGWLGTDWRWHRPDEPDGEHGGQRQ